MRKSPDKNLCFYQRLAFALNGIIFAFRHEKSFRTQTVLGLLGLTFLLYQKPNVLWLTLFILMSCLVLSLEMLNTSLEKMLDILHPHEHPEIGLVKDCAAGAVLIASTGALVLLLIFVFSHLNLGNLGNLLPK